jgi:hypothetical protein
VANQGKPVSHGAVKDILGRALKDPAFRSKLLSAPQQTLQQEGYHPSDAAVDFFKTLNSGNFEAAAKKVKVKGEHDPIEPAGEA